MRMYKPKFKKCNYVFFSNQPFSSLCLLSHFRYLASGDSFKSIAFSYRMGKSTVTKIIPEVCEEIWRCLQPGFMPVPDTNVWKFVASQFET